jgi:hypothetical protein
LHHTSSFAELYEDGLALVEHLTALGTLSVDVSLISRTVQPLFILISSMRQKYSSNRSDLQEDGLALVEHLSALGLVTPH